MARRVGRPRNPIPRPVLVDRAAEVFARDGFSGASMAAIAERCGIQKSSLFHRFSTKEALYLEVLDTYIQQLAALVSAASGAGGGFLHQLDHLGDVVTDYLGARPRAARLIVRELMDGGPYAGGAGAAAVQSTLGLVAGFLQAGMDSGEVPAQDARQLAMSICGVHLLWFAAHEVSTGLVGESVFDAEPLAQRRGAVRRHVRRLCGVAIDRSVD